MKNYFYFLMLFISPMMIAPISGSSHTNAHNSGNTNLSNSTILVDSLGPIFNSNGNLFCKLGNDCSSICPLYNAVSKNVHTNCPNNITVKWTVWIDLYHDGTIDYEYSSNLPVENDVANVTNGLSDAIKDDNGNGIKDIYVAPTKYGDYAIVYIPDNFLPKGSAHKIVWIASDRCGNSSEFEEIITVQDKKKPTPVCVLLATAIFMDIDGDGPLMPLIELAAIDFMNKAYDNCTADEDLFYTFDNVSPQLKDKVVFGKTINRSVAHYFDVNGALAVYPAISTEEKEVEFRYLDGEKGIQLWDPVLETSSFVKNCKQIILEEDLHTNDVMVTAWDKELNYDFCWTTLKVNFGCNLNPSRVTVTGNIFSLNGNPIKNITAVISAPIPEFPISESTDQKGNYCFRKLNTGLLYTIHGNFVTKKMQGLDYNDLSILERHISGKKLITNPYQLIAADINGDYKIDQQDYLKLFYALKYKNEVTFARSKVVKRSNKLNANNWKYFETEVNLELFEDTSGIDFIAIRTGDINGSHFSTGIINYDLNVSDLVYTGPEVTARSSGESYTNQITISPNPFSDHTTLSFFAPQVGDYSVIITDLAGRSVYHNQFEAEEGNNTFHIESEILGVSGSYICTLKSVDRTVTKRLVLIR